MSKGVADEYSSSLAELKENSKPRINMLTMLAEDYIEHSPTIVRTVEAYLQKVPVDIKLPVLYLIDSIVKNVGKQYVGLFTQNIVSTFCSVFEQVDEKIRSQMFKLRQTWNEVFPPKKLYALDARVNSIDPAWPITAPPPHGRIHINPKFLNPVPNKPTTLNQPTLESISGSLAITDGAMREELIKKQKELVELQKKKVELEILQTRAILEEQQKKLDIQTANFKGESTIPNTNIKPKVSRDIPEPLPNKTTNDTKPDKSKFEGAKRRDPRLHSRKVNDPRLSSRKENQQKLNTQPQQDTSTKPPPSNSDAQEDVQKTHKVLPKEEIKPTTSDTNKKSSESTSNTSRHQRKRSDRSERYKKHKSHKPRMKVLFGDSPTTKDSDSRKNDNSISKLDKSIKKVESEIRNVKSEMNSRFSSSVTYKRPTPDPPAIDMDNPKKRKEAILDKIKDTKETVAGPYQSSENITPSVKDVSPPLTKRTCTNVDMNTESEVLPMEIDEKVKDSNEQEIHVTESRPIQFKIDETPVYVAASEADPSVFPTDNHSTDLPLTGCGDIDLRLLPTSKTELEPPAEKKPKADLNKLFGEEDVDLRKSLVPPPPPPPIISKSDLELSEGWANIKRSNSDKIGKIPKKRNSLATSPKTSIFRQNEIEEMTGQDTLEADTEDRSHSLFIIMKEAEEQLKNETITYTQYNQMLKGVMSMNEESKLQEALRKDEMERAESPESGSNSSADTQNHFEKDVPSPSESGDSYRSHSTNCDGKSAGAEDTLSEQSKTSNDNAEGSASEQARDLRRRTRFKSHEPYHRPKRSGNVRFYQNEPPFFPDSNNSKQWPVRHQARTFAQRPPLKLGAFRFDPPPTNNRQKSSEYTIMPAARMRGPRHHGEVPSSLPPADPVVLDLINSDPMTYVTVGNSRKEVRFYGENAIVMLDWDDPRDLMFQPGSRRVIIDQTDSFTLLFNSTYREVTLSYGLRIRIRLGAPTRELFIDGRFYDIKFGGPPAEINIAGRTHLVQLEGPPPFLQIGQTRRTDLVAGKVNLIIDGNIDNIFHIYLDAKPQKFEINGVPFIIRFVEALQTVVINGQPLKMQFAGIPVPIFFHNERHFLRLTQLPQGIVPGFVKILNMEGGRLPTPPPRIPPPPPIISEATIPPLAPPAFMNQPKGYEFQSSNQAPFTSPSEFPQYTVPPITDKPIDALPSALPMPRFPIQSYVVEQYQEGPTPTASTASSTSNPNPAISNTVTPNIDVVELYQKLVAMGVVAPKNQKEEEKDDKVTIKVVDLDKPETLKQKQPGLINRLYSGIQCSSCGVRFPPEQTVKYSQHLDWHFRQNRREKNSSRIAQSRKYNYDISDWVQFQEIEDDEDRAQSWFEIQDKRTGGEEEEETADPTVPAKGFGENPCCVVCRDKFDQFFNEDKEEWQLKRAVCFEDKLYHPLCHKDEQESSGRNVGPVVMAIAEDEPIETIDLDEVGENGEEEVKSSNIEAIEIESSKSPDDDKLSEIAEPEKPKEEEEVPNEITETPPEEEPKEEEKPMEVEDTANNEQKSYDSDDDILAIEDIKPHIDTYDILDDDEEIETENAEEQTNTDLNNVNNDNPENNQDEDDAIKTDIIIKKEPLDIIIPSTNTSHINETIYLDGNSEFSAPKVLLPKKIKINISSLISKNNSDDSNSVISDGATDVTIPFDYTEPLPPGEEVFSSHPKPRLIGNRLLDLPPVNKGKEMSGLCSIM